MKIYYLAALLSFYFLSFNTYAQGLGQANSVETLDTLVITSRQEKLTGSPTSPTVKQAREKLKKISGGIGFVEAEDYRDNFTQSLGDTLIFTPGVFADTSAQRESRISIRGSGLNSTFERRGITVFRDNVPITRASGITEFQEIDPISIKYLEIYKGANALSLGTASLGGAINIVTPTGQNTEQGASIRVEAGSFDTQRYNLSTAGKNKNIDYYASLTRLESDGFRRQSEVDSLYGFGNIGFKVSDDIETRFFFTSVDDRFELAGSVSEQEALDDPSSAINSTFVPASLGGPGNFTAEDDDFDRNLKVNRLSNKTSFNFGHLQLETGLWFSNRKLDHAITRFVGIIDQDEDEIGLSLRLHNDKNDASDTKWAVGVIANKSENEARVFQNSFGKRGALTSDEVQNAENLTFYSQISHPIKDSLSLIVAGQYAYAFREEEGVGRESFNQFSPSIGLLWNLDKSRQIYANISRAFEVPGISDLTAGGANDFDPLDAQESTTFEIGSRGQLSYLSWDVSAYYSKVENEFIDTENPVGRPGVTVTTNSESDTIHAGLELGFNLHPTIDTLEEFGFSLDWRNSYTYNDFKFDNNPTFGNNTLAGVPENIYVTELVLESINNWYIGTNLRYIPEGPYVDFANTTQVDGYTLVGLTAGWDITNGMRIFSSIENITDEEFISNVSTVFEGDASQNLFTPGQGRAFYIGISAKL